MKYFLVEQIPLFSPLMVAESRSWIGMTVRTWLSQRVHELTYTSKELHGWALDLGDKGPPFRWIPERRRLIQAEIDASMMHLYKLDRVDVEWVLDSFTVLRKYEEKNLGEFQTKRLTLEVFDAMQAAIDTGAAYQTILNPPPGQGPRHPAMEHSA